MNIETLIQGIREMRKHGLLIVDAPPAKMAADTSKSKWAKNAAAALLGVTLPADVADVPVEVVRLAEVLREAADINEQQFSGEVITASENKDDYRWYILSHYVWSMILAVAGLVYVLVTGHDRIIDIAIVVVIAAVAGFLCAKYER